MEVATNTLLRLTQEFPASLSLGTVPTPFNILFTYPEGSL